MNLITSMLNIKERGIISFVGAGGKTTLMLKLAEELACADNRILVTTTTKIWPPGKNKASRLIVTQSKQELFHKTDEVFERYDSIIAASHHCLKTDKLIGFDPDFLDELWKSGRFHWILAEADGSSQKPIKAPALHEPAVPLETRYMLGLIGLSAFGKSTSDDHVHRVDRFKKITNLTDGDQINANVIAALIRHKSGLFKNCPETAETIAFLNQADVLPSLDVVELITEQLGRNVSDMPDLVAVGHANAPPEILKIYSRISFEE